MATDRSSGVCDGLGYHLDCFWSEPTFARFLRRLAAFSRVILFDKRGTGLSDRVGALPTLEQRMDDVRAVMTAAGSRDAVLLGVSEGGPMCSLFATTYAERTRGLVMIGTYAKRRWAPHYPWAPDVEAGERFLAEIDGHWGGPVGIETRAPSRAADPAFRAWWSNYLRQGASPGAAATLTRMNAEIDVRHVLPLVRVPTLVLHRIGDRCLRVEEGRFVAGLIPGAQFIELEGDDHLPFVGDQDIMLDRIESFVTSLAQAQPQDRILATVSWVGCVVIDGQPPRDAYQAHVQRKWRGSAAAAHLHCRRLLRRIRRSGAAISCARSLSPRHRASGCRGVRPSHRRVRSVGGRTHGRRRVRAGPRRQ